MLVNVIWVNFNDSIEKAECCSGQAIAMLATQLDNAWRTTDADPHKTMVKEVPLPALSSDGSKNGMKIFHFDVISFTIQILTATR